MWMVRCGYARWGGEPVMWLTYGPYTDRAQAEARVQKMRSKKNVIEGEGWKLASLAIEDDEGQAEEILV